MAIPTRAPQENEPSTLPPFVCISSVLRRLLLQAKVACAHTHIASIEGEPGSGKHLFAQTMHHQSALATLPFRRADAREWLASETDTSILSGTLYLDRIDLLAPTGQGLLLNLIKSLQDAPPPRFLLLASVHVPLRQLASQGHFLPDLAFRLSAVRFSLPPLRDHREDIAPIAQALLDRICTRYRQPAAVLASGTLPRLLQHGWPGNVRELASTLESAILESKTGILRPTDIDLESFSKATQQLSRPDPSRPDVGPQDQNASAQTYPYPYSAPSNPGVSRPDPYFSSLDISGNRAQANSPALLPPDQLTLNSAIQRHIHYVLELNRGNKLRAARQLGISRSTLYRILAGDNYSQASSSLSVRYPAPPSSE